MTGHAEILSPRSAATGDTASDVLWEQGIAPALSLPVLNGQQACDVAVVGGGVAGLSTTLHLAEAGIDVVLLEAGAPGDGASGRSGGLIAPSFITHGPADILRLCGEKDGRRLVDLLGSAGRHCFDLVTRLGIVCDARADGFRIPAHNRRARETLRDHGAQWRAAGHDVRWCDAAGTRAALGSPRYCGSLLFPTGGSLNPLALSRGLARATVEAGGRLFGNSPVRAVRRDGRSMVLDCPEGEVRARQVVLAANGGNPALHPALRNTVMPLGVIEFATAPLDPRQRAMVLADGGCFTDKQPYVFTARLDGAGRLVSAFPEIAFLRSPAVLESEAQRRLARHFPDLGNIVIENLWQGTAWLNISLLPHLVAPEPQVLAIQACNGRGLATNLALGAAVARALACDDFDSLPLRPRPPRALRAAPLARHLPTLLMTLAHLRSRCLPKLGQS